MTGIKVVTDYLRKEIFPQLAPPPYGEVEVFRLASDKPVYLFVEKKRNLTVVGKSHLFGQLTLDEAWSIAEREFNNLKTARDKFRMCEDNYEVVAPLGGKKELSALVVTRKAPGHLLDYYICRAIFEQKTGKLYKKLSSLAGFFVKLHNNTRTNQPVSPFLPRYQLEKLAGALRREILSQADSEDIGRYAARWWDSGDVFQNDTEVTVHGDATPTNFFINHQQVTAIDLEKMKTADRCWDLGFIAAELKHHFLWRTGNKWNAEPFIGHFLWEYASIYGNTNFFYRVTKKIPLYMAIGLLRIAKNQWLDGPYRQVLLKEAKLCLEYGL